MLADYFNRIRRNKKDVVESDYFKYSNSRMSSKTSIKFIPN